jgi:hypothetical protein
VSFRAAALLHPHTNRCANIHGPRALKTPSRFVSSFRCGIAGVLLVCLALSGCFIARPLVGASVDVERLRAAREAAVIKKRYEQALILQQKTRNRALIDSADVRVVIGQDALNKAAARLDSTEGRLDAMTTYRIRRTRIALHNGSAVASLSLLAHSEEYNIDVDLTMDCLLIFSIKNDRLAASFEPFNISPDVNARGLMALAAPMIRDVIAMKISTTAIPPMELPIDLTQETVIPALHTVVRSALAMEITMPRRVLHSTLRIKDVMVLEERVLVIMAMGKAVAG